MTEEIAKLKDKNERLNERLKQMGREKANLQMAVNLINQLAKVDGLTDIVDQILQILVGAIGGSNIAIYYQTEERWRYVDILGIKKWMEDIDDVLVKQSVKEKTFLKEKETEISKLTIPGFPATYETWVYPLQVQGSFFGAIRLQGMAIEHAHYRANIDPFIQYSALILYHEISNVKKLTSAYQKVNRAREAAEKSKEQFELAMEASQDGLFDWNLITNEIYYSPGWKRLLGYEDNEIKNDFSEWERLTKPEHAEESWALLNEVLTGKRDRFENEFQMLHKNGHWVDILARANVIFDENGRGIRVVGTHVDLTARKASERALKESEKKHRSIIETAMDGFWLTDCQGRLREVNATYQRMSGFTEEELLSLHIFDLDCLESSDDAKRRLENIMLKGEERFESRHRRKDGTLFDVEVSVQYRPEQKGQFIFFFRDITEIKKAETEREKLQAQLLQAQKMESVGRLAGGVAHDFNNMLGVILGHTELALLQADEKHDLYADLKEIQSAAKRSADITKQLLAFARKQTISPKKIDLNDTVESMLNMLRRLIGEDIDLVWKPSAHLWPVKMDPSQLDQILANLCVNARDAITGVGKLIIETGRKTFDEEYCKQHSGFIPGEFVLLAVSDNGCGMDKDTLDNLFEPFFTTKEVGKGTGLGLATIYGIVKQNNGFINVYSEPGQGATFKIYLPRLVAAEDADKTVPEKKTAAGGKETILLVEDEPTILRMTRMMLERKGYIVISAATPSEAIEKAKNPSTVIDLLMTDVVMPEMNGRDLAANVTAIHADIKLLFMSGYTANVIAHQGILDDGVVFIQKPFSMADMTMKVREILDTSPHKNQA